MDPSSVLRPQYIPSTQQTIPPTQYAPAHHSQYMFMPYAPLLAHHDPNNNAYIGPASRPQSHISIPQQQNDPNDAVENLLRLRPRAGNPRVAEQYINTYGMSRSSVQPTFSEPYFEWSVYGVESETDDYVSIFKCASGRNKISVIQTKLGILQSTISKCSMRSRSGNIKTIEETCTDVTWWQQPNCPFSPSVAEQPETSVEDVIDMALEEGLNPETFKERHPKIGSVKSNVEWFTNCFNAKQKEKRLTEQKEAVEWFTPMLNPIQLKVIEIGETARAEYCNKFDSDAKRVLMGHRDSYFFVSPGNRGLSTVGKFFKYKHGEEKVVCISGGGKSDDVNTNFHSQMKIATDCDWIIWNVSRESAHLWRWNSLEQMNDALTTTNKYNSITKMIPPPTPLIITNKMFELQNPATKKPNFTLDRIHMYQVLQFSDEIIPIDVYEYYKEKYDIDPRANENAREEIQLKDL